MSLLRSWDDPAEVSQVEERGARDLFTYTDQLLSKDSPRGRGVMVGKQGLFH